MKKKKRGGRILILIGIAIAAVFCYLVPKAIAPEGKNAVSLKVDDSSVIDPTTSTAIPTVPDTTTFTFAGDMMFDRYVNHSFKNIGLDHVFDNLDKTLFSNSDIRFANLEGPISAEPIVDDHPARSLVFNMPPTTISALNVLSLNGVSLANNHTLNAGNSGFDTTKQQLDSVDIGYAGTQNGFSEDNNIIRYNTTIPVAIICVDYLAYSNNAKITAAIQAEKAKGEFVIIFPHWGTEYSITHTTSQETAAKTWIDAGADLVVGSHPHVVEDVDIYKNKPIIYSLGNFVLDQTFSADTQQGLIVSGTITAEKLELKIIPIQSIKLYPQLATDTIKNAMLSRILSSQNLTPFLSNGDTILVER